MLVVSVNSQLLTTSAKYAQTLKKTERHLIIQRQVTSNSENVLHGNNFDKALTWDELCLFLFNPPKTLFYAQIT